MDGKEVDRKTIPHTIPLLMSIDETFDIGLDTRTPVDFTYDSSVCLHRNHRQAELQDRSVADDSGRTEEGCGYRGRKTGLSSRSETAPRILGGAAQPSARYIDRGVNAISHTTLPWVSSEVARRCQGGGGAASPAHAWPLSGAGRHRHGHCSRFAVLSDKTLLFLADFDGELAALMADLAKQAGPVFDTIFQYVNNPPPTPVTQHRTLSSNGLPTSVHALNLYTAYPGVTVKEFKALSGRRGGNHCGEQRPFLVVPRINSRLAFLEVERLLKARGKGTTKDLDSMGTPHFAQFVPLEDNQIGFFTVYDGSFDQYIADFTKTSAKSSISFSSSRKIRRHRRAGTLAGLHRFCGRSESRPDRLLPAYPGLTVVDIHGLIADSKSQSASAK